jgi:hypothetical protein
MAAGVAQVIVGVIGAVFELLPEEHPKVAKSGKKKTNCLRVHIMIDLIPFSRPTALE